MTEYEQKFIKFYKNIAINSENSKTKLATYANEMEHAYTLSRDNELKTGLSTELKNEWEKKFNELTLKTAPDENNPFISSVKQSLYGKHKKTIEKFMIFFFTEYNRIKEKTQYQTKS